MAARVYLPNLIGWPLCIYYRSTNSIIDRMGDCIPLSLHAKLNR